MKRNMRMMKPVTKHRYHDQFLVKFSTSKPVTFILSCSVYTILYSDLLFLLIGLNVGQIIRKRAIKKADFIIDVCYALQNDDDIETDIKKLRPIQVNTRPFDELRAYEYFCREFSEIFEVRTLLIK